VQDAAREQVLPDDLPVEALVRRGRVDERRRDQEDDRGGDPPPGVSDRDGLDLLGVYRLGAN